MTSSDRPATKDFEKLGVFYLGAEYDLAARKPRPELLLYNSKDLTTHAVCVGMTGSGKTGLCLALLEEAAIDGIPAIAIDPKGDLGNLLLTFPELRPEDFRPWVDPNEAARKSLSPDDYAKQVATTWREGLAASGEDGARIARFRSAVDLAIYTPGSNAGLPLTVLRSFAAPPAALVQDTDALRERVTAAVSGLLALLGIDADPIRSREHILLSNLLDRAWRAGQDLDMAGLIREIQSPPLEKVGFIDLETFFPAKERFTLAMSLNNLLASPGFAGWMEGEALDVGRLLYTPSGKPRLSILSIAHLSDSERMFFVTILLNEVLAWMRTQTGTSSLRALLYMDEVFGFFPPTANPPSKPPMLTLLKQGRAFGLGIVLATQNPVDLDYKGLSNAGTWFLGRLQTERDKARVLDGLEGASATAGATFDRQKISSALSALGNRVFLMNNVHEDEPVVFQTRWTLSYLCGPLAREQIQSLMAPRKRLAAAQPTVASPTAPSRPTAAASNTAGQQRPVMAPGVPECFVPVRMPAGAGESLVYHPALVGVARVHFVDAKSGVDYWEKVSLLAAVTGAVADNIWEQAAALDDEPEWDKEPESGASFAPVPAELTVAKNYGKWSTALKTELYRSHSLKLSKCPAVKETSRPGESDGDFRARLAHAAREDRDAQVEKLQGRYAPKLAALQEQIRRAGQRVEKEQVQYENQTFQTIVSIGTSLVGALLGRKAASMANAGRAATAIRSAGRAVQQHSDIGQAKETVESLRERLSNLEAEFKLESDKMQEAARPEALVLEPCEVKPRKSDIAIDKLVLAWTPWRVNAAGNAEQAF